jgi:hypothetical protein
MNGEPPAHCRPRDVPSYMSETQLALSGRWLRKRFFGISMGETTFTRRGFHVGDLAAQQRLEQVGSVFLNGYHTALENDAKGLVQHLDAVELNLRGFAFEGAAMGLALLDQLTPWKGNRWQVFLSGPGSAHAYMMHVGVGWALARIPWSRIERVPAGLDPLLRWLAVDGYGFHHGYFYWPRYIEQKEIPNRLFGYARHAFDQGLGRSLWFVNGADVSRIEKTISLFPSTRRGDLWSGVGLAAAYAGAVDRTAVEVLRDAAGHHRPQLAQGAAFAAKARERAGNPAAHTEMACQVFCGLSADKAARITDDALSDLPGDHDEPAYEVWRRRIREHFVP